MTDPPTVGLSDLLPPEYVEKLDAKVTGREGSGRLNVLRAREVADDESWEAWLWRKRERWGEFISAAGEARLFEGSDGKDLRGRLSAADTNAFRSALGECLAVWFVTRELGLSIAPRPGGRPGKTLEFEIVSADPPIQCEVKAPYRERTAGTWGGNDASAVQLALEKANKQFDDRHPNLLILTPHFRIGATAHRDQLTEALFGKWVLKATINRDTGAPFLGPLRSEFDPDGHFLSSALPSGRRFKDDGSPRFTRVSGLLCIEEVDGLTFEGVLAVLVHNPHASIPLPRDTWGDVPQFDEYDGYLRWSDEPSDDEA